jgi:hypothetical protein
MGRKKAQNSNNSPELEQVAGRTIDRIEQSRTFEPWNKPQIGSRFFIFKQKGDFIQGILGQPITNFQRATSYPIEQIEDGEVVEIFANRLLHRIFQKHELIGTCVRVVYIGRQYIFYGGHARKIYRVYKVKGTITQHRELVSDKTQKPKNKKRRKHGQRKTNN